MGKIEEQAERFWAYVDRQGEDDCWPWVGWVNRDGYGVYTNDGMRLTAHRVAFYLTYGWNPQPLCLHTCGNSHCCNPAHLYEGTHGDNMRDRDTHGRTRRGDSHTNAKLSSRDVRYMRLSYATGQVTQAELAKAFHISTSQVSRIMRGEKWA